MSQTTSVEAIQEVGQTVKTTPPINMSIPAPTAFLDPESNYIYISSERSPQFWSENKVAHMPTLSKGLAQLRTAGKLNEEFDKVRLYEPQYQAAAEDYFKHKNNIARTAAAGGIMVPANFTTIDVTNVLSELRGTEELNYVIQDAVSKINTQILEGRIDVEAGFDVHKDVAMGAEIPTNQVTYTTVTFSLPMLGAHVARFQEMTMTNLPHDPYRNSINRVGRRVIKAKAEIVRDAIATATVTSAGGDWDAVTSGDSNVNPFTDIGTASDAIVAATGNPEVIVMNDKTWRGYVTNTWISGTGTASNSATVSQQPGVSKVGTLPGTGLTAYVDSLVAAATAFIFQKDAIVGFQGPSAVTTYDDVHHRANGYYYWEYFAAKIIQDNRVYKLTGLT